MEGRPVWHTAAPAFLPGGTQVAGYRIEAAIGQGGMGVVYEAMQLSLNRIVALKLLAPHLSEDPVFRERFRREGMIQAGLEHPHIVTIHEAGETEHGLFLAMRLVRGPRLKDLIVGRELDVARTLHILADAADALDAAHEAGLIHRDVKPQNVLVAGRDHAYLSDFGLTKLPGEKSLTDTGQFMGTLDYVSPEQIVGERATARTDVYALTGVLCECLTGTVPYPRETEAAILYAHLSDEPPRLSERNPDLPEALDELVARGMAKEPGERPASAGDLMYEVRELLGGAAAHAPRRRPSPPRPEGTVPAGVDPDVAAAAASPTEGFPTKAVPGKQRSAPTAAIHRLRERRPRRVLRLWPVLVLLAALAVAFAVLSGGGGDDEPASAGDAIEITDSLRAGGNRFEIGVPEDWVGAQTPETVRGFKLADRIQISPADAQGEGLLVGRVVRPGPGLLPSALVERLDSGRPRSRLVRLGDLEALRYGELALEGRQMTVFVVPYTGGAAAVTCFSRGALAAGFFPECERVATTFKLLNSAPQALMPSEAYASALERVFGRLDTARQRERPRLAVGHDPSVRGAAAEALKSAFQDAGRALGRTGRPPVTRYGHTKLRGAARRAVHEYGQAAAAASGGDTSGYAAAIAAARGAEADFQRARDGLAGLGYELE